MKHKSFAQWPAGTVTGAGGTDITEDTHESKEAAEAVCDMLRQSGFGGDRSVFPINTWVEPV